MYRYRSLTQEVNHKNEGSISEIHTLEDCDKVFLHAERLRILEGGKKQKRERGRSFIVVSTIVVDTEFAM